MPCISLDVKLPFVWKTCCIANLVNASANMLMAMAMMTMLPLSFMEDSARKPETSMPKMMLTRTAMTQLLVL